MENDAAKQASVLALGTVRARLTGVWLVWAAIIVTIVLVQSVLHKYGGGTQTTGGVTLLTAPGDPVLTPANSEDRTADVWKWLLPNLLPTLTTMVAAVAGNAFMRNEDTFVRRDFYHAAMGLSVFYLMTLSGLLLSQPLVNRDSTMDQLRSLQTSNIATGPIQGLVASALGVLFVTAKSGTTPTVVKADAAAEEANDAA